MMEKNTENPKETTPPVKDELLCNYNYALNEEFDYLDKLSKEKEEKETQQTANGVFSNNPK